MELNSYFRGLLAQIEPKPNVVTEAKSSHETLRSYLHNDDEIAKADPETYLSGSYARDTAIKDIKDVDIIVLLDIDHVKTDPDVVIAWLLLALQKYYAVVIAQGRSVQVTTVSRFLLDVVPAEPMSHKDGPVWIPDRDAGQWVASHPKGQISFGIQRNASTDGYYKHLVKIMKHWRDRLITEPARVKSYILESLVAQIVTTKPASYAHAVVQILQGIDSAFTPYLVAEVVPSIPDPGYPSVNVAKRWKFHEFTAFMKDVSASREIAEAALADINKDRSVLLWQKLFGQALKPQD